MSVQEGISQFKPQTVSLSEIIKKNMKVGKDGVAELSDDVYEKTLEGTGLDLAVVKKVQKHNSEVVSAMTLAVGEKGLEVLKKNDKLETVTADMKAGMDEISVQLNRQREVTNPTRPGEKIQQFGATTIKYSVKGTANSGELKKVRQHLMSQANDILNA